jgi:hypothetical protein
MGVKSSTHVAHTNSYKISIGTAQDRRSLGRPMHSGKDNIKISL